jgi:hypothetical protein
MICPLNKKGDPALLLDYTAGALQGIRLREMEDHLTDCCQCAEFAAAQSIAWERLGAWEAPRVSDSFDRKLLARIEEERFGDAGEVSWWESWVGLFRRPAFSGGLAALLLVTVALFQEPPAIQQPLRADGIELEQVERFLEDMEMLNLFGPAVPGDPLGMQPL